jgi:folate-dependent phosphoribosylglycinamide formyltransferase PurN
MSLTSFGGGERQDPRELVGYPGDYGPGPISTAEEVESLFNLGQLACLMSSRLTNVAVVADRGPLNLRALGDFSSLHPTFGVSGVVAPGSELDYEVVDLARRRFGDDPNVDSELLLKPGREENIWVNSGDFELRLRAPDSDGSPQPSGSSFRFAHEGYDIKRLRDNGVAGETSRAEFCDRLISQLSQMNPDVVFLDNFKVLLAPNIVQAFEGKIINIHPSVLPLIKGFRPEKRAYEGESPEASGYTLHVVNEDMDGGPTLFQERVPVLPVDTEMLERLGESEYAHFREEQARVRIMYAQRKFVPWVLSIYASGLERKVVEEAEAFGYEGRAGFEQSAEYQQVKKDDAPYQRLVFRNPAASPHNDFREWVTLEHLLSAPPAAEISDGIGGLFNYQFTLARSNGQPMFGELITRLESAGLEPEMSQLNIGDGDHISLRSLGSCARVLAEFGVSALQERMPTHVLSRRKPIKNQEIVLPHGVQPED